MSTGVIDSVDSDVCMVVTDAA